VLCAPPDVTIADAISEDHIIEILGTLQGMFDYVIVDTPPYLDGMVLSVLEHSDLALMVVDPASPRNNVKLHLDALRLIKYPTSRLRLVLNCQQTSKLDPAEIEHSLGLRISAVIPANYRNSGSLADRVARRHTYTPKAFATLCRVVGADIGNS